MMRSCLTLVGSCLLSAVLAAPLTYAAEASASEQPAVSEGGTEKTAGTGKTSAPAKADKSKKDRKKDSKDGGIFIPSEEISEDFAVSFPVDI